MVMVVVSVFGFGFELVQAECWFGGIADVGAAGR